MVFKGLIKNLRLSLKLKSKKTKGGASQRSSKKKLENHPEEDKEHSFNGFTSTDTTASLLEAIQMRILQEEATGWDTMDLDMTLEEQEEADQEEEAQRAAGAVQDKQSS